MAADHTTRWLIRRDVEAALELGAMVPWDEGDMLEHNKLRNGIAMVCENSDQQIVGWLAYTVAMPHVSIANIACDDWTAPATALVQRLLNKMGHRRDLITVSVPDYRANWSRSGARSAAGQLGFRVCCRRGFRWMIRWFISSSRLSRWRHFSWLIYER